jgi:hypothetical protein
MNTFSQVDRSLKFCEWLGYQEHFIPPQKFEVDAYYQNVRQAALRTTLKSKGYTHYADQKVLTTVIAKYFKQDWYGTVGALRNGFAQYDQKNAYLNSVRQAALQEVERIKLHKNSQPLVVIHIRYSSNANEAQNSLVDLNRMKQVLEDNEQRVWFVFADGRVKGSFNEITTANRTNVFPYPHPTKKYAASSTSSLNYTIDYGKFYHLQLLLGLLRLNNVRFVGNTSGTLDVAAFIGHNVYNMHVLTEAINYQTARILIQSSFLAVECYDPSKEYGYALLLYWLEKGNKPSNGHVRDYRAYKTQAGYRELFYIQSLSSTNADIEVLE